MDIYEAIDATEELNEKLLESFERVKAKDLGLDPRAGYALYVSPDAIGVDNRNLKSLQYYGGFEYVDDTDTATIGDCTFFLKESERVARCLERYYG